MTWQTTTTLIVRNLIGDTTVGSYTYSDEKIQEAVAVSAQLMTISADFVNTYTIDLVTPDIDPDPTATATLDNAYVNLISLRAACIIVGAEVKIKSGQAVSIKDGPSSIDMSKVSGELAALHKALCDKYDNMLKNYQAGQSIAGKIILGPYSPGSDYVSNSSAGHRAGGYFGD